MSPAVQKRQREVNASLLLLPPDRTSWRECGIGSTERNGASSPCRAMERVGEVLIRPSSHEANEPSRQEAATRGQRHPYPSSLPIARHGENSASLVRRQWRTGANQLGVTGRKRGPLSDRGEVLI